MAGSADSPLKMLGRVHLFEPLGLGCALFMALRAQHRCVGLLRDFGTGVARVLPLGTMAGLAIYTGVFALRLFLGHIHVAGFTSLMSGMNNGQRGHVRDRITAVVAVLPEAGRNEERSKNQEQSYPNHENADQS